MRIVMTSLAVLALVACDRPADTTNDANAMDANMAMEANMADANMMAPAEFHITETSWEFTMDGKAQTETVDASGNYVAWAGTEHVDHGTAVMKDGKACFDSAMDQEGEICWTDPKLEVGQSGETTSDKGEKLAIKRIAYTPVPDAVKPEGVRAVAASIDGARRPYSFGGSMQPTLLTIAALLMVATMGVHSILGQKRLIRPILKQGAGVMKYPLARFILPFGWHLMSFMGLVIAAILFAWAWAPGEARTIGLAMTGIVFTAGGLIDAVGSKGQHVGWPPLTLIGLLSLAALFLA